MPFGTSASLDWSLCFDLKSQLLILHHVDSFSAVKQGSSRGSNYTVTTSLPELDFVELYYSPSTIAGTDGTFLRDYTYSHHTFLLNFTYEDEYSIYDILDYDLS